MELRNYETVFILTPILSDTQVKDTVEKFKKILEEKGSEIIYEERSKLKKLSYPIQNKATGIYQTIEFKSTPTVIKYLEQEYKRDENILRFLTVSLDKLGVEYNINKKKIDAKREKEALKEKSKEDKKTTTAQEETSENTDKTSSSKNQ